MNLRLLLISHASTAAMRAGRIPADDPLDARGLAAAQAARATLLFASDSKTYVSPALCARETASALGLTANVEAALADMNYGELRGRPLSALADAAIAGSPNDPTAWMRDPNAAPDGGESFNDVVQRAGQWLDALHLAPDDGRGRTREIVAVTHAPVIRAALVHVLGAPPAAFPRIEIAPLSVVHVQRSAHRGWTWWPASRERLR